MVENIQEDEDIAEIIEEIGRLEAKAEELRTKYNEKLNIKGLEVLTEAKIERLWSRDIDTLKNIILNYFKVLRQFPAPSLHDKQQNYNMFYNIILFLNKYLLVLPLDPKTPKTLPHFLNMYKREKTFFDQLYNSFINPLPVSYAENKYRIWMPSWKHRQGSEDIIDYVNDLEFFKMLTESQRKMDNYIENILTDLSDMVDIGDIMLQVDAKKEKHVGVLD